MAIAVLAVLSALGARAQTMSVASFEADEADQTANLQPTMYIDQNGDKCALIKINTTQKNFSFDVGMQGVAKVEPQNADHPSEIWLYVPHGVKKISIQHNQLGQIKDYDLGMSLKKGRTYVMNLTSDKVNTLVVDYNNLRELAVDIEPHEAELFINGVPQKLDANGKAKIEMAAGSHSYLVKAKNYHPEESQITIDDRDKSTPLSVRLKQAFGYLTVNATPESQNGTLYIDGEKVGTLPISAYNLKSGTHELKVLQKLYSPYVEKISMTDSAFVNITPILEPNYAEYEIFVTGDKDAKIYDNGELLGEGHWKGRLEAGDHLIEAKKVSHTTAAQSIKVEKDIPRKVSVSKPMPIYGTLEVKTQPSNAQVYIDGSNKPLGYTDYINSQLLIGPHHVKVMLDGHKTEEFDVTIKEGQTERINQKLTDFCYATISSNPTANISINDIPQGRTPLQVNRIAGEYKVCLSAHGYTPITKTMRLDGTTKDMNFKLHRNYTRPNEFYIQAGYNVIGLSAINMGLGMYIKNVNLEGSYLLGLSQSEKIYWTDTQGDENDLPFAATYKANGGTVKVGYGIRLNSRLRLTPQVGAQFITLKETVENSYNDDYSYNVYSATGVADGASAASFTAGVRINVALAPALGLSVSPEYKMGISKSAGYEALSNVSKQIKDYTEGFNCNVSLNLFF